MKWPYYIFKSYRDDLEYKNGLSAKDDANDLLEFIFPKNLLHLYRPIWIDTLNFL